MSEKPFRAVNQPVPKADALSIMGGAPVYTEDLVPPDALTVRLVRSPYAFARVRDVDVSLAEKVPGVVKVITARDLPRFRHSYAGENYPGNNPFDRVILDDWARYVGDPVAIVAAETGAAAEKAVRLVKADYEPLPPVLDFEHARDEGASAVHPEEDYLFQCPIGGDLSHNVLCSDEEGGGDFDAEYAACPIQMDETWYTPAVQQAMMETFRTYSYWDQAGRLTLVSSTQVVFHARRIVARALGLPQSRVRVIKPRVGGGFGAKQSLVTEVYAAAVTYVTGRPAFLKYTRQESCACGNTRHQFRVRVRLGAEADGTVRALWVDSLENAGAYGEHAVNVVGLSAHKTIPLYGKTRGWRFTSAAVYTNTTPGGAYRGFGATQGCFAVESTVNKMCQTHHLDPARVRLINLPAVGEPMPAYYGETLTSCSLDRCIETGKKMIGWAEKYTDIPYAAQVGPHRYRGLGMAVTMQGSGLTRLDRCSVILRLEDTGDYSLSIGASDIGTGCDTILAQMAAEVLECDPERVVTSGVDSAYSPYDKGSYASSTTYVTGNAVVMAARDLLGRMRREAALRLNAPEEELLFDGSAFRAGEKTVTVYELGRDNVIGIHEPLCATAAYSGESSPPPFAAAFAEVEVDTETGEVDLKNLVGVIDCGTVINKSLARVQAEGGFAQGAGMALLEQVAVGANGKLYTDGFLQYRIPARPDVRNIRIAFEESREPSGPFGAKSMGEVVINSPAPAITAAIRAAVGAEIHSLPATAEKVFFARKK